MLTNRPEDFRDTANAAVHARASGRPDADLALLQGALDFRVHQLAATRHDLATIPSNSADAELMRADVDLQDGLYDEARRRYEGVVRGAPSSSAFARMAFLIGARGEIDDADRLCAEAEDDLTAKDIADLLVSADPGGNAVRAAAYRGLTQALAHLGIALTALGNLTSGFTATFNAAHPDAPGVKYFSYAGVGVESRVLKPAVEYIEFVAPTAADRPNDGVVSVTSATCGRFMGPTWAADHFSELGYQLNTPPFHSRFDHLGAIRGIVANATKEDG